MPGSRLSRQHPNQYQKNQYQKIRKKCVRILIPLAFWLGIWQIAAMTVEFPLLLPTPVSVLCTLLELAATASFWMSIALSLVRVLCGLALGCVTGCALAVLTWRFRWADVLFSPVIRVIRATPVVSFILLVYLWVARANIPEVISSLMVMPVIWSSLRTGLETADGQLLEMAKAYRFGRLKTLRLIWLPSLRPHLTGGFNTALGLAWKSGIAAEVICPPRYAIGTELSKAKTALQSPELYAWTVTIVILSLVLEGLLKWVLHPRQRDSRSRNM